MIKYLHIWYNKRHVTMQVKEENSNFSHINYVVYVKLIEGPKSSINQLAHIIILEEMHKSCR